MLDALKHFEISTRYCGLPQPEPFSSPSRAIKIHTTVAISKIWCCTSNTVFNKVVSIIWDVLDRQNRRLSRYLLSSTLNSRLGDKTTVVTSIQNTQTNNHTVKSINPLKTSTDNRNNRFHSYLTTCKPLTHLQSTPTSTLPSLNHRSRLPQYCNSNYNRLYSHLLHRINQIHPVRWPSGLRRQLKVIPIYWFINTIAGPKGRGFKSHSHQYIFCFLLASSMTCDNSYLYWMGKNPGEFLSRDS